MKLSGHLIGGSSPSANVDGKTIEPVTWSKWEEYCPKCEPKKLSVRHLMVILVLSLFVFNIFLLLTLLYFWVT